MTEEKKNQVIALGRLGWSLRRIEEATGVRRETASGYVKAAGIAMRGPGGWGRGPAKPAKVAEEAKPAIEVATGLESEKVGELPGDPTRDDPGASATEPEPNRSASTSTCEPYRELIVAALARGRNAMGIWQDLVDGHGFAGRYNSVKRFVTKLRGHASPEARVVIETAPGEEAQVDYGTGPMVRDPATGRYRKTRLFVMTLGCSRKAVRLIVFKSSTQKWAELHEQAFRRIGGATKTVVLDNLGEGVLKPDIYDPVLNSLYRDVLAHYGAVALPCRVADPDRKAYVSYCTSLAELRSLLVLVAR